MSPQSTMDWAFMLGHVGFHSCFGGTGLCPTISVLLSWLGLRKATFDTTDQEDVWMSWAPGVGRGFLMGWECWFHWRAAVGVNRWFRIVIRYKEATTSERDLIPTHLLLHFSHSSVSSCSPFRILGIFQAAEKSESTFPICTLPSLVSSC